MPKMDQFEKLIVDRINKRINRLSESHFSDKALKVKATRIGLLLTLQTKKNIKKQKLIDHGHLLNSIASKATVNSNGFIVEFGSRGINYAAIHEFGFVGTVSVRSHKRKSKLGKSNVVRAHDRKINVRRRPYIRPSLFQKRDQIAKILREAG